MNSKQPLNEKETYKNTWNFVKGIVAVQLIQEDFWRDCQETAKAKLFIEETNNILKMKSSMLLLICNFTFLWVLVTSQNKTRNIPGVGELTFIKKGAGVVLRRKGGKLELRVTKLQIDELVSLYPPFKISGISDKTFLVKRCFYNFMFYHYFYYQMFY